MGSDERTCTFLYKETKLYKGAPCNANILRKEPFFSTEESIGHILTPKNTEEWHIGEKKIPAYLYQCENGHILYRPEDWADVPIVPPGTIISRKIINKQPKWYQELTEKEKEELWK